MRTLFDEMDAPVLTGGLCDRVTPRPYQADALRAFVRKYDQGKRSFLMRLPTGTGKTLSACLLMDYWRSLSEYHRVAVICYERILVEQFAEEIRDFLPWEDIGIEMASDGRISCDSLRQPNIIVASRATLSGNGRSYERLDKFSDEYNWLVILDECLAGDSVCTTPDGPKRIDQIEVGDIVLSHDGSSICWRPVTRWWDKGVQKTLKITFESGREVECTASHALFTQSGWKEAGQVSPGESVLSTTCPATGTLRSNPFRRACVAAARLFRFGESATGGSTTATGHSGTTSEVQRGTQRSLASKDRPFWARCLATRRSLFRVEGQRPRDCRATTPASRRSGRGTRPDSSRICTQSSPSSPTRGTATQQCLRPRDALHASMRYTISLGQEEITESGSTGNGSTALGQSDWPGGSATTAQRREKGTVQCSIRKDSPRRIPSWLRHGYRRLLGAAPSYRRVVESICRFACERPPTWHYATSSPSMSPTAWHTKYDRVVYVSDAGHQRTYDIEVDGTHRFFANGALVHNCHGWSAKLKSCGPILEHFNRNPSSCRVGLTATPQRSDGVSLSLVAEHSISDMRLGDAIDDGWLLPLRQKYIAVEGVDFKNLDVACGDFKDDELDEVLSERQAVASMVSPLLEQVEGRRCLVFCPAVNSARVIADAISAEVSLRPSDSAWGRAEFMYGGTPTAERKDIIRRFQRDEFQFLAVCNLCRAGYNDRGLGAVAVFRPTKSRVLAEQMKGRAVRPLRGVVDGPETAEERRASIAASSKPDALIIDLVGVSGLPEVATTAQLYLEGEDDEILRRVDAILLKGDTDDIEAARKQAREERDKEEREAEERRQKELRERARKARERDRREALRRAKLEVKVDYTVQMDAVDQWLSPSVQLDTTTWATDAQVNALVAHGIELKQARSMTRSQAGAILGKYRGQTRKGASPQGRSISREELQDWMGF